MNDSFLEDLDLVPKSSSSNTQTTSQASNKYITTRKVLSRSQSANIRPKNEDVELKAEKIISSSSANLNRNKIIRRSGSQEVSKSSESDSKPRSSTPKSDKKRRSNENPTIPEENLVKDNEARVRPTNKLNDIKVTKDSRRSGSTCCTTKCFNLSSKENTQPSTESSSSSKESGIQSDPKKDVKHRRSDLRKSGSLENTDPIELLNAIKHLVSRCTEQENMKVMRSMQNLHINSQANLIKHIMHLQDNVVKELNLHKNRDSMKSLIEENEKMKEDIFILHTRNEILQKKVNELALLKEENASLKLKLKELHQ